MDEIDDFIEEWHEHDTGMPLYQYLGMTKPEYNLWVADPAVLPYIVNAHRQHRNVSDLIEEQQRLPMAARAQNSSITPALFIWLKSEKLWD